MNWKTAMYLDMMDAQSSAPARKAEHDRTVRTLKDLIKTQPEYADLWRGCLAKLESGYDL